MTEQCWDMLLSHCHWMLYQSMQCCMGNILHQDVSTHCFQSWKLSALVSSVVWQINELYIIADSSIMSTGLAHQCSETRNNKMMSSVGNCFFHTMLGAAVHAIKWRIPSLTSSEAPRFSKVTDWFYNCSQKKLWSFVIAKAQIKFRLQVPFVIYYNNLHVWGSQITNWWTHDGCCWSSIEGITAHEQNSVNTIASNGMPIVFIYMLHSVTEMDYSKCSHGNTSRMQWVEEEGKHT